MSKILTVREKIRLIYNQIKSGDRRLGRYCSFRDISEISMPDKVMSDFSLPKAYLILHYEFDGFRIGWCDFLSSTSLVTLSNDEYKEIFSNWEYSKGFHPFSTNAGGDIFTFSPHDQKIWMFGMDYFDEPPRLIADSFEAFMNDCVLGNRYLEFSFKEDNYFYDFLVEQGWIQE